MKKNATKPTPRKPATKTLAAAELRTVTGGASGDDSQLNQYITIRPEKFVRG